MRSSTCINSSFAQGTSLSARYPSMSQGVRPPLTPRLNRPRAATAARACSAMNAAALRATASTSARVLISTFGVPLESVINDRVLPSARRHDVLRHIRRAPRVRLVLKERRRGFQERINDSPGFLDIVLPGKKRGIALHRVAQEPLICIH